MSAKSSGLGKGLDLIFMENNPENENIPVTLKISELEANKDQPRINFNDDSLKVINEFLNNDYDDLEIMLQDDSIISETALNVINECIRPYMSDYWVDDLQDELERVIMWHIRLYFNIATNQ